MVIDPSGSIFYTKINSYMLRLHINRRGQTLQFNKVRNISLNVYWTNRSASFIKEIKFPVITRGYGVSVIESFPSARGIAVTTSGNKQPESILHLMGV